MNVALKRPSYQVSTYSDASRIYYAKYANDGRRGTHLLYGPCAHTRYATNPWWAVDLGVALYVYSVKFANRGHGSGELILLCQGRIARISRKRRQSHFLVMKYRHPNPNAKLSFQFRKKETDRNITNRVNVDAIFITDLARPPSPATQWRATCQPITATADRGSSGIVCRLPATDTLAS